MTTEAKMIDFLAKARQQPDSRISPVPPSPSSQLFFRAQELALHPELGSPEEREQLKRLIAICDREMHPSWWTMLLAVLGRLDEARTTAVQRHRQECARCQSRLAGVETVRNTTISVVQAIALPAPSLAMAQASTVSGTTLEILDRTSPDGRLVIDVFEDRDKVFVEVRSREQALNNQLIGCVLRGQGPEPLTRYVVLASNQTGQHIGHVVISREFFFELLGEKLEALDIAPVDPALLTAADTTSLSDSLEGADDLTRSAWKSWLQDASQPGKVVDPTVQDVLKDLQNQLQM